LKDLKRGFSREQYTGFFNKRRSGMYGGASAEEAFGTVWEELWAEINKAKENTRCLSRLRLLALGTVENQHCSTPFLERTCKRLERRPI